MNRASFRTGRLGILPALMPIGTATASPGSGLGQLELKEHDRGRREGAGELSLSSLIFKPQPVTEALLTAPCGVPTGAGAVRGLNGTDRGSLAPPAPISNLQLLRPTPGLNLSSLSLGSTSPSGSRCSSSLTSQDERQPPPACSHCSHAGAKAGAAGTARLLWHQLSPPLPSLPLPLLHSFSLSPCPPL